MTSISDLSNDAQFATSAGCRALERKMIDDLMAKVNFTPDKVTSPFNEDKRAIELALTGFNPDKWLRIPRATLSLLDRINTESNYLTKLKAWVIKSFIMLNSATNRALFKHLARSKTSQIDSTATQV